MSDTTPHHAAQGPPGRREPWRWAFQLSLIGFLAIAGFFLWTEHRAHLLGALPFLLLLACPLLHLLHHGRHGGDHRGHGETR